MELGELGRISTETHAIFEVDPDARAIRAGGDVLGFVAQHACLDETSIEVTSGINGFVP